MNSYDLVVKESDYGKLISLIELSRTEAAEQLEDELSRAEIVEDSLYPVDAVSLGTRVSFVDLTTDKRNEATVVPPAEANLQEMKISILTPMGSALIGLRVGGEIEWQLPGSKRAKIKVLAVYQQER